jgi:uncharacterized protein YhaN
MITEKSLANLEAMNQEALQIFEEKKSELRSYGAAIDEAERILALLHRTLGEKQQDLSSLSSPYDDTTDRQSLSNSLAQRRTRDVEGVRSAVREVERLQAHKRMLADEMNLMAKEIADLDEENEILRKELIRLNSAYRSMTNK